MKISWGTGILLSFIVFITFILFFVIRMSMDHRANHDLVTEDYYQAELGYQKEIDAEVNAIENSATLKITKTPEGLLLQFPKDLDFKSINGIVSLYRPSGKQLDFDFKLSLSDANLLIPDRRLSGGRWDIKVAWEYEKVAYLHKERITY